MMQFLCKKYESLMGLLRMLYMAAANKHWHFLTGQGKTAESRTDFRGIEYRRIKICTDRMTEGTEQGR